MTGAAVACRAAGRTHVGYVRSRNEDSFYVGDWLYAVADGLGGHVAGDLASATVMKAFSSYDLPVPPAKLADAAGQAVDAAGLAVRRAVRNAPEVAGMGTTLVALLRSGCNAVLVNLGDSRAYLLRGSGLQRELIRVTEDHVYGNLVSDAHLVPMLPERITRFIDGRTEGRSADLTPIDLQVDDRILLCSDGLSSYVPHELIGEALCSPASTEIVADDLVTLALDHGGHDNVTVVVVDVVAHGSSEGA